MGTPLAEWPTALLSTDDVLRWIDEALPRRTPATGPHAIYRVKAWGVTARFDLSFDLSDEGDSREPVIFKASYLPIFAQAPRISSLLARHCPNSTPQPLAWTWHDDGTWVVFRSFDGEPIVPWRSFEITPTPTPPVEKLAALARTFALVQATIADVSQEEVAGLPRFA